MRICVLHGSNDRYGASKVLVDEVEALESLGHEVVVIVPSDGPLGAIVSQRGLQAAVVVDDSIAVLRRSRLADSMKRLDLPPAARDAHAVVLWTLALALYVPLLRRARIPFYLSVHELLLGWSGSALLRLLVTPGKFPVAACSEATAQWLVGNGVGRRRIRVGYPVFEPISDSAWQERVALPGGPGIAVIGRINGHKGHLEVARAFMEPPLKSVDCCLYLAGAPYPGQEHALKELHVIAEADPRIRYVGEIAGVESLRDLVSVVAVFPTRPEPFGLVPIEAWRAGLPSVGFNDGGAREALQIVGGRGVSRARSGVAGVAEALESSIARPRGEGMTRPALVNAKFSLAAREQLVRGLLIEASSN